MNQVNQKRRFLAGLSAMGALGLVVHPASAQVAGVAPRNLVNVGPGREFTSVQAAMDSILDASESNPYLILVDPGLYNIVVSGGPIQLKPFVSLVGMDRNSVIFVGDGDSNIRTSNFSSLANVTIYYSGNGSRSGAIRNDVGGLRDFFVDNVYVNVSGYRPAFASHAYITRMEIRNCNITTQGVGIDVSAGGVVYMHDTNVHLYGTSAGSHIGIRGNSYCRIYVFGGKIGSGYGYAEIADPGRHVIGVLADVSFSGRIVLHGVWSICRNDGAGVGVNVNCIRVAGNGGWVRVFGGYYQAENPTGPGQWMTFSNPGNGRIEVYGTRARNYGEGPVYSTNQIGLQQYDVRHHNIALTNDSGGLALLDASSGPFTIKLPSYPCATEQYIFKKIDASKNQITISGNGRLIDGASSRAIVVQYDKLHIRFANNQFYIVG